MTVRRGGHALCLPSRPVLVVSQAGDAHVSPGCYPTKHESHRQVPTWNYRGPCAWTHPFA
ncbi:MULTISPECIES: FMN-binding negative transcriptional regulator [Microvirgula]|uniref:FMN-binding negative transcriptional regulator n=1 Tax=Microvirgula TaxID=57479 RepID=UPI00210718E1|nr:MULTISPECIES: FMN-binding negative transcriptional regulator [Microvirgula]